MKSELKCLDTWGKPSQKMKTWFRTVFDYQGIEVEIRDMRGHWYKTTLEMASMLNHTRMKSHEKAGKIVYLNIVFNFITVSFTNVELLLIK